MTRFARAKGSKASNERVFSDPTPWHEIKNQMLKKTQEIDEEKKRREAEAKRNENYQKFLKERDEDATNNTEWADFPEDGKLRKNGVSNKSRTIKKQKNKTMDIKLKKKGVLALEEGTIAENIVPAEFLKRKEESNNKASEMNGKKSKKKKLKIIQESKKRDLDVETSEELAKNESPQKKKKTNNINSSLQESNGKSIGPDKDEISENEDEDDAPVEISSKVEILEIKKVKTNKKKIKVAKKESDKKGNAMNEIKSGNQQRKEIDLDSLSEEAKTKLLKKQERKRKQLEKRKLKKKQNNEESEKNGTENPDETGKPNQESDVLGNTTKGKKIVKQMPKEIDLDSLSEEAKKKVLRKQEIKRKQAEKKKLKKKQNIEESEKKGAEESDEIEKPKTFDKDKINKPTQKSVKPKPLSKEPKQEKKVAKKKKLENGEVKRRKDFHPNKIMVNGNEVQLEYFDGFPIRKEDAQNLIKLKKEMISKGLPRSEINRTLKMERRRAEKGLAREKKRVCFNCRKFGHNLSECPMLSNKDELVDKAGAGICFKCGSTEHTSFVCRVEKGPNFKFATCFICKEQGHISRQCPDNARGLYPKGGSCRVCGDVTHLKRDCPQFQDQQRKEEAKFQVATIFDGNPDDLDSRKDIPKTTVNSTKPKIIKF